MAKVEFYDIKPNTPIASLRRDFEGEELNMQFDVDLVSALNQYVEQQQNPRHHPFARTPRTLLDAYSTVAKRGQVHRSVGENHVGSVRGRRLSHRVGDCWGLRRSCTLSDQIALSFKSFSGYLVSRHSIPPLTRVVDADLSMA
jgi:hypothetical protein